MSRKDQALTWQDEVNKLCVRITDEVGDGNNVLALSSAARLHGFLEGVLIFGEKHPTLVTTFPSREVAK